jgi:acetylornithine deacetylase/succinyl-diaminopimelate desuccinylase-like protein
LALKAPLSEAVLQHKYARLDVERKRIMGKQNKIAENLAAALKFKTITHMTQGLTPEVVEKLNAQRADALTGLRGFFLRTFPILHKKYPPIHINTHTLIFELKGSDASLKPYLLYAHQDVVPCPADTLTLVGGLEALLGVQSYKKHS